jgi:tol-pal system protein YbgF
MMRRRRPVVVTCALRATALAILVSAAMTGCASGERAAREREIAALRSEIEAIRKGQEANTKGLGHLAGEMKALDAQSTFVISEVKASSEERARVRAAIEESNKTLQALQSTVDGLSKAVSSPPASPPAAAPAAPPSSPPAAAPGPSSSAAPDAWPEQLFATAMTSVKAEELVRAVVEFRELTKAFPNDPLASSAQYWIGEAYYRQRDFAEAVVEFQKVVDRYPTSAQIPEALLKIGLCHRALDDQAHARVVWEEIVAGYPGTNAASQARSLLATLGGAGATTE